MRGWLYHDIISSLLIILVRGWIYRNIIFSFLIILVRGWLYRDIIFSLLIIFGQGVIYCIVLLLAIFGEGVIISWHYIFTPDNIWWGGDYFVTLYFHSWQYLVKGWLYHETIFLPLTVSGEGVIISWHHIFTPDNISWGGDYIVTWYSHPRQYLVRGWLYRDIMIIFSLLAIFGQAVIILWHYIFTPDNICWWGDYIVTCFHSWRYLVRGWLYHDITISFLRLP